MRVLVCGGRDFRDCERLWWELGCVHAHDPITVVITGGASGADSLGRLWAEAHNVASITYEIQGKVRFRSTCPARNRLMLEEGKPDLVVAFPGGYSTADCVTQALALGIRVRTVC